MSTRKRRSRPAKRRVQRPVRRNPGDLKLLETARRLSKRFHGRSDLVVELEPHERQGHARFAAVVGELASLTYAPLRGSQRGGTLWTHLSGDRGPGKPNARSRPLLVVDPKTRRPFLVMGRSPMRFSSKRGLVA